jgi:hypothetical protein
VTLIDHCYPLVAVACGADVVQAPLRSVGRWGPRRLLDPHLRADRLAISGSSDSGGVQLGLGLCRRRRLVFVVRPSRARRDPTPG